MQYYNIYIYPVTIALCVHLYSRSGMMIQLFGMEPAQIMLAEATNVAGEANRSSGKERGREAKKTKKNTVIL